MSAEHDPEVDPPEVPILRLRITHITSTMSTPLPTLAQYYVPPQFATAVPMGVLPHHAPVIRIFGTTPALQKICANIHLCYPYFYVPYPMDSTDPLRPERVVRLCQRFAVSLNHAICLAMRQNPTSASNKYGGGTDPKHLHVVSVMLVKGTPFYGYHVGYNYFLKVSLVNPQRMYVALEQLRKPAVLGREWQPHEAHMNHVLQFMCDFDLYGCGWLDLSGGTFRAPLPEGDPYDSPGKGPTTIFNSLTVPSDMVYPPVLSPPKDSHTPLEIDILPNQIINRRGLKPRALHQDFVELLQQPLDPKEKLVPAVAELWEDERRRRSMRGQSLAEEAMMPGLGMGGRSMEELGYKVPGKEVHENQGGHWKISEELWGMLEERMGIERRRKGRLTFERFSGEIRAGKEGEKLKYDRWVMTTFKAVSAHWPKLDKVAKSTQRSKRSRKGRPSSAIAPSSPIGHSSPPPGQLASSPLRPAVPSQYIKPDPDAPPLPPAGLDDEPMPAAVDDVEAFSSDEDDDDLLEGEGNPFHLFAMTQAPMLEMKVEVDSKYIAGDTGAAPDEEEEEEAALRRHTEDVQQRADAGRDFRATQAAPKGEESDHEYGDEELDALFRKTVTGGFESRPSTPRRRDGDATSHTPTTRGTGSSGGSVDARRYQREKRMRELAGWGDLSTIMDRSSVSLTPPANPYDDRPGTPQRPRTPTGPATPVSDNATPTSMVRNLFAKKTNGPSPLNTPSKHAAWPPVNTVILPPSKRSVGPWSPSPEKDEMDESPSKATPRAVPRLPEVKVKSEFEEISAQPDSDDVAMLFAPAQQQPSIETSESGKTEPTPQPVQVKVVIPMSSPTQLNEPAEEVPSAERTSGVELPSSNDPTRFAAAVDAADAPSERPKKRVRMAGPIDEPENPFTQHPNLSQRSQLSQLSQRSASSAHSHPTVSSDSTDPAVHFAKDAWQFYLAPPSARDVTATMESSGIPTVIYQEPYYSNPVDVPPRAKMFAGRMFALKGNTVADLQEFDVTGITPKTKRWLKTKRTASVRVPRGWEYAVPPPRLDKVVKWCHDEDVELYKREHLHALANSQLSGPTQKNRFGFKFSQKKKSKDAEREAQNMSVLCIEVFAKSRHQLLPDPEKDEITSIFFCYQNEDENLPNTTSLPGYYAGYAVVDGAQTRGGRSKLDGIPCTVLDSELDLINWLIDLVKGWDPDVLGGWELHNASWGYVTARAQESFGMDLTEELSRVVGGHTGLRKDFYSATHTSTFKVSGRHVLNVWRICRAEINLTQYSFENVAFHLLHQRIPRYSAASLTALWKSKTPEHTNRVLKYFFQRVVMYCEIIDAAEIITKNAEFARVFGVDFASVMFRGSQFKVESFMFRIAKPESFVFVSPSKQQVGLQNAPFAVPLIAEPESKYYTHPILVLDFQSLYPSIMIAYNICYSTCLGRVEKFKGTDKFGFTELKVADGLLELLKDYLTVTPNGMVFVKPAVRKSLLAKMLGEILDTRVMVKQGMKGAKGNKTLLSLLNARQLGLKLMANVTYGYTSATYSGRMPCIEVADSIVQTGRETLEKAQELIHSRPEWDARVVYGDTDSLFVALPGRSKDQAFKIGNDIADAVTAMNPKPVKLKFEKVYLGSVLMAKKRYVGFKYEHPDELEPIFDAKGIETIRRDGFPAQQKIEEVCLKMLFRNQDLSEIKEFCRQEWTKILQGRVSPQEFIVAKEVRLGSYSDKGVPPPGAAVAYRRILKDPRDEPQYAERVPYIVSNADGRRLIDRARMPEEMLANRSLGIDAEYYIRNLLIPPLSRIFNLVGADVENWFDSMPRVKRAGRYEQAAQSSKAAGGKMRIDSHFKSSHCVVCGAESPSGICKLCIDSPSTSSHTILSREHLAQEKLAAFHKICASCSGTPLSDKILCDSIDCPLTYARSQAQRDVEDLVDVRRALDKLDLEGPERREEGPWVGAMDW